MKSQKKMIVLSVCAGMVAMLSACSCWQPINENCVIPSHKTCTKVKPRAVAFNQVTILPCLEAYRPSFTAGSKRVHAVGNGYCAKAALEDAVAKICIENDCDMISAAKAITVRTTHPRWIFFSYDTYQVKLSGLPLTMTSMVKEKLASPPPPVVKECKNCSKLTKEDIKLIVIEAIKNQPLIEAVKNQPPVCKPAMIQLKDIRLSMTATAETDSKVAVKLPACNKK